MFGTSASRLAHYFESTGNTGPLTIVRLLDAALMRSRGTRRLLTLRQGHQSVPYWHDNVSAVHEESGKQARRFLAGTDLLGISAKQKFPLRGRE